MNLRQYHWISVFFSEHPRALFALNLLNKLFTAIGFFSYPFLLILLILSHDGRLFSFTGVPAVCFLAVSFFRKKLDRPRPYEMLAIHPVIKKDTKGHSFPSRHVFSMFLIAALWLDFFLPMGIFLLISGTFLAIVRVIGGVHFIKDVIAGAIMGAFAGMLSFLFL